jgi:cobalt-zinc-cadmium efflux system outer membrane protein
MIDSSRQRRSGAIHLLVAVSLGGATLAAAAQAWCAPVTRSPEPAIATSPLETGVSQGGKIPGSVAPLQPPVAVLVPIGMPPRAQIQAALTSHPRVLAAQARERSLQAGGDSLRAGQHETVLRTTQARRRSDGPGGAQHEWLVGVERTLRSATKREADGRLADQDAVLGGQLVEDARHETARELLRAWFAWQRAAGEARLAEEQLALVTGLTRSVEQRVRAGDAAQIEAGRAGAELERARAVSLLARARESASGLTLRRRFPEIAVDSPDSSRLVPLEVTEPLLADRERLRDLYLERSHEIALARGEARRAELAAERARAERRTDPSIGAFAAFDRGGSERVLGIAISLPLAGPAREAGLRGALAEHQAASARASDLERRVQADFEVSWSDATARASAAWALAHAAVAQVEIATRLGRAYTLGEAALSDWLLARRNASEAQQQALGARLEAIEAAARLRLDLHELAGFDD